VAATIWLAIGAAIVLMPVVAELANLP